MCCWIHENLQTTSQSCKLSLPCSLKEKDLIQQPQKGSNTQLFRCCQITSETVILISSPMCPQPPQTLPKHCSASLAAPHPSLPWDGTAAWSSCTPAHQWTEISWQLCSQTTTVVCTLNPFHAINVVLDFKVVVSSVALTREATLPG